MCEPTVAIGAVSSLRALSLLLRCADVQKQCPSLVKSKKARPGGTGRFATRKPPDGPRFRGLAQVPNSGRRRRELRLQAAG